MPDDPIPRPVNNTKQLILLLLIPLCGCSPTYVLKSNTTSRFDTLRVAFVPFFNVTGNYKEDKKGTGIAGYLQNGIAGRLGAASCFKSVSLCQFSSGPEYVLDSIPVNDGYFRTVKPNVNKSTIKEETGKIKTSRPREAVKNSCPDPVVVELYYCETGTTGQQRAGNVHQFLSEEVI